MSLYTDGSPSAWESWYMDTYGVWPTQQAVTAAQTQGSAAPVMAPQPVAATPAPAPTGPVSANPWGTFNGDFTAGLSPELMNYYRQRVQSFGPTDFQGADYGRWGDTFYVDDPTGRYRIVQQDAYSAPYRDEYGRQMVRDKNGNEHPYDPESQGQGLNVIDLQTQQGAAYDPSGKFRGALNLAQEIDPMDLVGIAMVAAPFAAAVGAAGAGAAAGAGEAAGGAGAGAAGAGTTAGTVGVTGANGAFLGEGVASGIGAWDGALAAAGSGAAGAGAAGVGGTGGTGGTSAATAGTGGASAGMGGGASGSSSITSAIQSLFGGGGTGAMSWTDLIGPALQLVGGAYSSHQAGEAADTMAGAAQAGIDETRRQFDTVRGLLAPYVGAGNGALAAYQSLSGLNGADAQRAQIEMLKGTPQYDALVKAGENAILQNASATGGLRGGNVQGALADQRTRITAGLIGDQLNRYGSLINIGQNSAAGTGSAAMTTGQSVAQLMQQQGAAQAGGIVAGTNALTNAIGGVGGFLGTRNWQPSSSTPASTGYGGAGVSGGGGFGTGVVYGNQDYGQYF